LKKDSLLIYIVILNWNGKEDTLACLSSLEKIPYEPFCTVVVDNGSSDGSQEAIRSAFPKITLIENGKNLGFAGGNNVGIRLALEKGADAIFLLNNDTVADPAILQALTNSLVKHPEAGIFGPKLYLHSEPDRFDHLGGRWNKKRAAFDFVALREKDTGQTHPALDYACGAALFVKREVFEAVGLLEENFFLIWEEADFCMRAKRAGFVSLLAPDAKVWHRVSASFVGGKPHSTYFWWRGRLLWIERNCSFSEKISLYAKVLIPEMFHIWKLLLLKSAQLKLTSLIAPGRDQTQKREKIVKYRAALQGIKDYALRRFGSGPAWIYKPITDITKL
jgi:GT2 family glycosyltransferase